MSSEFTEQSLDMFLHIRIALVIDVWIFKFIVVFNDFCLLLRLLDFGFLDFILLQSVELVFLLPPLVILIVNFVELVIKHHLTLHCFLLFSSFLSLKLLSIFDQHTLQLLIVTIVVILHCDHIPKSPCFVFFIEFVPFLLEQSYFVVDIFNLLEL